MTCRPPTRRAGPLHPPEPGKVNLANAGLGAVSQLCGMLFQKAIGVELTAIPYQGTAPALTALLGSRSTSCATRPRRRCPISRPAASGSTASHTTARIRALPDAPTLAEGGLKGFEVKVWHGIYAPKGTPPAVIARLNGALRAALRTRRWPRGWPTRRADRAGGQADAGGPAYRLQSEIEKWSPIIKAAGVKAD